ncbi:T9SS C-terminal target domain-containing protein [candidate division KSB1 bacterium]|nr:endo-1,4-beta-xylanase [candidate division KSB1 bacterium]RQW06847.1 MAG: T9SS C-terminal target domain-containing protein [candidate division KSB1 bacterium]
MFKILACFIILTTPHLEYEGQDVHASWRQQALQRIEHIRMKNFIVKVVNRNNEPVEGAKVVVRMRRHAFGFGSAVSSELLFENSTNARLYQQKLENLTGDFRSFNIVTIKNALKWLSWEDDNAYGTKEQARYVVEWFVQRHIKVRGHNLLWPNWDYMPADLQARHFDRTFLVNRIKNHIFDEAGYSGLKGNIAEWDVLNEINQNTDLEQAMGSKSIYADCLKWAALADPHARLTLNENDILTNGGMDDISLDLLRSTLVEMLQARAPLQGLGMQSHMGANFTPPERLLKIFDKFSDLGLAISITEYDAVGADEAIAADYMRDILIAAYSHPSVFNFIMWGFWDSTHWKEDSPLFRKDWSLKPSGQVFIDTIFEQWWTDEKGSTDSNGLFTGRGYVGDYDISVSFHDQTATSSHTLENDSSFILRLDTDQTMLKLPSAFRLEQNYPNPFNQSTTMHYYLPNPVHVTLELYDLVGRKVDTFVDQQQAAGRHSIQINGSNLANGIYYVHMTSGALRCIKKVALIK